MGKYLVGLDIGGTFTDIVIQDASSGDIWIHKVLTNAVDPAESFIKGIDETGIPLKDIRLIIHATTLGTNMFLGQMNIKPPPAILITNKGFIDVIEIGRQNRPELYNLFFRRPKPLIPRRYRIGVSGRIDAAGKEVEPINQVEIENIVKEYCGKIKLFIVSLLHSYINPQHETTIKKIIMDNCRDAIVVLSHEVDPRPREYERTTTTIINGLLIPVLSKYLSGIREALDKRGFKGSILVMRSSGGVSSIDYALRYPASFIESGPAAGAVATAYIARQMGIEYALGFDMGGTTAKASSIIGGTPLITDEYEVGGSIHMGRIIKGSGYPLRIPHIDLAEVSSGGGTIAWVDEGGALRVGPLSAGAYPGPACYGRGGEHPTITDAHLVLGRLPNALGDGEIILDRGAAEKAINKLVDSLGLDVDEVAWKIIELANQHMARAIRLVTVERGLDPGLFTLFAFGGAGPLHAADLMDIGFKEAIIPNHSGVFSAYGLLYTDYKYDFIEGIARHLGEVSKEDIDEVFKDMLNKAYKRLDLDGLGREGVKIFMYLDMRYWGQAYKLSIPYNGSIKDTEELFHEIHAARYGYMMRGERLFIESARLELYKVSLKPKSIMTWSEMYRPNPDEYREVYIDGDWVRASIYDWGKIKPGAYMEGPALIMMKTSTALVPDGFKAVVDSLKNIHLRRLV